MSFMIQQTETSRLTSLLQTTASSNGVETRVSNMTDVFFMDQNEQLDEMQRQSLHAKNLMKAVVMAAMLAQHGDDAGNFSWSGFTQRITEEIEERARRAAQGDGMGARAAGIGG